MAAPRGRIGYARQLEVPGMGIVTEEQGRAAFQETELVTVRGEEGVLIDEYPAHVGGRYDGGFYR